MVIWLRVPSCLFARNYHLHCTRMIHRSCRSDVRKGNFDRPRIHYLYARRRRGCWSVSMESEILACQIMSFVAARPTPLAQVLTWSGVLWVSEIVTHLTLLNRQDNAGNTFITGLPPSSEYSERCFNSEDDDMNFHHGEDSNLIHNQLDSNVKIPLAEYNNAFLSAWFNRISFQTSF
jgi:hypothetical protein